MTIDVNMNPYRKYIAQRAAGGKKSYTKKLKQNSNNNFITSDTIKFEQQVIVTVW